jgi:hypothetical protein
MYGDFSRLSFARDRHYSAVLLQQGRVGLDADANEQAAIGALLLRTLAEDVIGPHGGPAGAVGFQIVPSQGQPPDLGIGLGRYYVHGVLCEVELAGQDAQGNDLSPSYYRQPDRPLDPESADDRLPATPILLYLQVFERLVTAAEDPSMREPALGANGPDTAARLKVVWQVLATNQVPGSDQPLPAGIDRDYVHENWPEWEEELRGRRRGRLIAKVAEATDLDDPCIVPPTAGYRGENQLYRVEIHSGGRVGDSDQVPTFKWSRENGSVALPVLGLTGKEVRVATLGRDPRLGVKPGDLVELCDDRSALGGTEPARLSRVQEVDPVDLRVILEEEPTAATGRNRDLHPLLRRWDHQVPSGASAPLYNALPVREPASASAANLWLDLEQGIQIAFPFSGGATYRQGDFWLIPARANGTILWQGAPDAPVAQPPFGVRRWFAPLAIVADFGADPIDLRCQFTHLSCSEPAKPASEDEEKAVAASAKAAAGEPETAEVEGAQAAAEPAGASRPRRQAKNGAGKAPQRGGRGRRQPGKRS